MLISACPDEDELLYALSSSAPKEVCDAVETHLDACSLCRELRAHLVKLEPHPEEGGATVETPVLTRGTSVGRYLILEFVDAGRMGEVYAAYDPQLERKVALKRMDATMSLREARAMARLSHPNVLAVYDAGIEQGIAFVATELVSGGNLQQWLSRETSGWREILEPFVEAGKGLAAAHAAGWIHGDFKPENVLVGNDGRVRVADFGLAVGLDRPGRALGGTPRFLAPEIRKGGSPSTASDQFAFSIALQDALAGGRVPGWLRSALERGSHSKPEHRFASMSALLDALRGKRKRTVVAAGMVSLLMLTIFGFTARAHHCGEGERSMETLLGGERLAALREDALATQAARAPSIWAYAERHLKVFKRAYAEQSRSVCERGLFAQGAESAQVRAQRRCLDARKWELEAQLELMGSLDLASLDRLPQMAPQLEGLKLCIHAPDVADRDLDGDVARELAKLLARARAGLWKGMRQDAAALMTKAEQRGLRTTVIEAGILLGTAEDVESKPESAQATFEKAAWEAERLELHRLAARAWVRLISVNALGTNKLGWSDHYAKLAKLALSRAGGDAYVEMVLEQSQALVDDMRQAHGEALGHYQRALALARTHVGEGDLRVAISERAVGLALFQLGRHEEALAQIEHARLDLVVAVGEGHPQVGLTDSWLGSVLTRMGRHVEAQAAFSRGLDVERAGHGRWNDRVAGSLGRWGQALVDAGEMKRGTELIQQSLEIAERLHGRRHLTFAEKIGFLAEAEAASGRWKNAEAHFREASEIFAEKLGPESSRLDPFIAALGESARQQGRRGEARAKLEEALRRIESYGTLDRATLRARTQLSLAHLLIGERSGRPRALALLRAAEEVFLRTPAARAQLETTRALLAK